MVLLILFLTGFYLTEDIQQSMITSITNHDTKRTGLIGEIKYSLMKTTIPVLELISNIKSYLYISDFQSNERNVVAYLSDSPILRFQDEENIINPSNRDNLLQNVKNSISDGIKKPFSFKNILIVGDSMISEAVGITLENNFIKKYPECKITRKGVYSTGLSRTDYFNWSNQIAEFLTKYDPDILIIMMGTNDAQSVYSKRQNKYFPFKSDGWNEEYKKNVKDFLDRIKKNNIRVFWIGLPITEKGYMNPRLKLVNKLQEDASKLYNHVYFISTWDLFRSKNHVEQFLKEDKNRYYRIRVSDGIHLTLKGADRVVQYFLKKMTYYLNIS